MPTKIEGSFQMKVIELLEENQWSRRSPSLKNEQTCPICCCPEKYRIHDDDCWLGKALALLEKPCAEPKCKTCGGSKKIKCDKCNGQGADGRAWSDKCSFCKGTGKISCPDCKKPEVPKCETCEDTGKVRTKTSRPAKCSKCDGWGWLPLDPGRNYQESCPECGLEPCPDCPQPEVEEVVNEKERRIYWQTLAYKGMSLVDRILNKKITRGTGTTEEEFAEDCKKANNIIIRLTAEKKELLGLFQMIDIELDEMPDIKCAKRFIKHALKGK